MENYKESIQLVLDLHPEYTSFDDILKVVKTILPYRRFYTYPFGTSFKVSDKILSQFSEPLDILDKYSLFIRDDEIVFENKFLKTRYEWKNIINERYGKNKKDYLTWTYPIENDDNNYEWKNGWKSIVNSIYGTKYVDTDNYINILKDDDNV